MPTRAESDDDATTAPGPLRAVPLATARLAPGSIIAGRYRLVALLGRGGMGEVYRADDLTLDQPVALKFLPASDIGPASLAQLHNELRVARQVSHKNVCRLYDLGDANGRRFLTMEYVDGEDLASLLRRIGRIPEDKATSIARQLCAGVAAAHERGVLHRDLKPANVMLDGDGNVRITDFGIATAGADADTSAVGTPQYMAPELFAGKPASVKSDLYALGLVLFEVFTGRRAYDAKTLGDLKQLHDTGTVTTPSSIVRDLDPAIERVIMRCLSKNPDERPATALAVAAILPGGDPLAAALAAGETPSADLLAAAAETDAMPVARAVTVLVSIVVGLLLFAALSAHTSIVGRVPLPEPPAVLVHRAEEIIATLGYTDRPADRAHNFQVSNDYLAWIRDHDATPRRWDVLSAGTPPGLVWWYRTSPREMLPLVPFSVRQNDPPHTDSGMRTVILDTRGRLVEFNAVPPQVDPDATPAGPAQWDDLFAAAGLPMAQFSPVAPKWTPRGFADARAAWEGVLPEATQYRVRVEAASYRGKPVFFGIVGPWTRPDRQQPREASTIDRLFQAGFVIVVGLLFAGAVLIARHNLRRNRADRRGAARVATVVLVTYGFSWLVSAHHLSTVGQEFTNLLRSANIVVANGVILWVFYIAVEPYVRRFWPDSLLGWSRLLSGRVRDPRVGRDVLAGIAFGVALSFGELGQARLIPLLGLPAPQPTYGTAVSALLGPGWMLAEWTSAVASAQIASLTVVLTFVVLRLLLRRTWLTVGAGMILMSLTQMQQINGVLPAAVFPLLGGALLTLVVMRFGLLTLAVMLTVVNVVTAIPLTLDLSHWSATVSTATIAALAAVAIFAFYSARAGQPLFGRLEV